MREERVGGCAKEGRVSLLFMLSVGYIDRLHQSPASYCATGGEGRGERDTEREREV